MEAKQYLDPVTGRYVKVTDGLRVVLGRKDADGPYDGIPIINYKPSHEHLVSLDDFVKLSDVLRCVNDVVNKFTRGKTML
jgi:hypothetical protein